MKNILSILLVSIILFSCTSNNTSADDILEDIKKIQLSELTKTGTKELPVYYYKNDLYTGPVEQNYSNGTRSEMYLKDGKFHGVYKNWHQDGFIITEMNFKDGKYHGLNRSWHDNGKKMYESSFRNGVAHGLYLSYYSNGQLKNKGQNIDGKKDGYWKIWDENGKILREGYFVNGEEIN